MLRPLTPLEQQGRLDSLRRENPVKWHSWSLGATCKYADIIFPLANYALTSKAAQDELDMAFPGVGFKLFDPLDVDGKSTRDVLDWVLAIHPDAPRDINPFSILVCATFRALGFPVRRPR